MIKNLSSNKYIIFYKEYNLKGIYYNWEFATKLFEILDLEVNIYYKKGLIYDLVLVKNEVSIFLFKNNLGEKDDNKFLFSYHLNNIDTYPFKLIMHSYTKFKNLDLINIIIIFERKFK